MKQNKSLKVAIFSYAKLSQDELNM